MKLTDYDTQAQFWGDPAAINAVYSASKNSCFLSFNGLREEQEVEAPFECIMQKLENFFNESETNENVPQNFYQKLLETTTFINKEQSGAEKMWIKPNSIKYFFDCGQGIVIKFSGGGMNEFRIYATFQDVMEKVETSKEMLKILGQIHQATYQANNPGKTGSPNQSGVRDTMGNINHGDNGLLDAGVGAAIGAFVAGAGSNDMTDTRDNADNIDNNDNMGGSDNFNDSSHDSHENNSNDDNGGHGGGMDMD